MMIWSDIACIVFLAVTINHLGLIGEIEHIYGHRLKVVNCPKCLSFWLTVVYGLWGMRLSYGACVRLIAVSLLCSYLAIWLELFEGYIDTLYNKVYEKIYQSATDNAPASGPDEADIAGSVSEL